MQYMYELDITHGRELPILAILVIINTHTFVRSLRAGVQPTHDI